MNIIIVGASRVGRFFLEQALADEHEVVVIEKDKDTAAAIGQEYDCMVIHADAATRSAMDDAGAENADALIAVTTDDAVNLLVAMQGKSRGIECIASVVADDSHIGLFKELGIEMVENPFHVTADSLYRAVSRPGVTEFLDIGDDAEVVELQVAEGSEAAGKTLGELGKHQDFDEDCLVVSISRESGLVVPRGGARLEAGDRVTLLAKNKVAPKAVDLFCK